MPTTRIAIACVLGACGQLDEAELAQAVATVHVHEDTSGKFAPYNVAVMAGDRVTWHFPTASPGNAVVRRVSTNGVWGIAPYTPGFANELAGPMLRAPSGVFALGPAGNGLVVQHDEKCESIDYEKARREYGNGHTDYLCRTDAFDNYGRTMESTWSDPGITGVFIRLRWKDLQPGPNVWNDEILIRETDAAVAHGKLYSLVIESGRDGQPVWLTIPVPLGGLGLPSYELDWNDEPSADNVCDPAQRFHYVDPTTQPYGQLYNAMLTHVADVLKQNSARYRARAYIKPSGANRATGENRLPTRCKVGDGCICNNQVWAEEAHYKPSKLYAFYAAQIQHIAQQFPGKTMSYMLIQAGFPRVGEGHCWADDNNNPVCPNPNAPDLTIPGGTEQTEHIVESAILGMPWGTFVVEHQGLDADPASLNPWVLDYGGWGIPTMFQTSASGQVGTMAAVGNALDTMTTYSLATALEIYEERLWEANGQPLGAANHGERTIGDWNAVLHDLRRARYPGLGDPAPSTYTFTFGAPVPPPPLNYETDSYVDPRFPLVQAATAACGGTNAPCIRVY
jgi:hypothetical protein